MGMESFFVSVLSNEISIYYVRPGSSYGKPTLEIQKPNGTRIKIRYGD